MRRLVLIIVIVALSGLTARAGSPDVRPDGVLPESSRWSSFARLVYGRWDAKARMLHENPSAARLQFWNCVNDAWFIAYGPMLRGKQSPCLDLARTAHETEDDGAAPAGVRERFATEFGKAGGVADYAAYLECVTSAYDHRDPLVFDACALAIRPRERVLATLTDDERFDTWFNACKKILLADVQPAEPESGEALKTPHKALTDFQKTQGRHCFRTLPALYEVRGMKKLSDFWTPEEQKALYLRSKQLGQN